MVAILTPRRLRELLDVTQPMGTGLPDSGVPVLHSSNSYFVIETIAAGGGGAFSMGASNLGNTLGDTGVTGSTVVLAGIGNITLSQATDANGGTITISGGSVPPSFALSASNNVFSTGTVVLAGAGGGVTVDTQAANTIRISVAAPVAQTEQTQNRFDLTIDGNTAGAGQLVSSGTLTLAGGSNITLSQNGNAISIIGNAAGTETQVAISGIAASNTTYTSGTVNIVGSGIVTVQSGTGQRVIVNASQSVQPETQTFVGGVGNSQTTYTSGTINLSALGAITVRSTTGQAFQFSVNSQSVQPETQTFVGGVAGSNTTYTSGTITITGVGGGVTVSSNTGQRIDISVAAPVAQTGTQFSAGISGGNTSGNSGTVAGRVVFAGGNNITLSGSTNGVSETVTISAFNQSAQTGISSIVASDATYTSGSVQFTGSNMITVKSSANQRVVIDATQSVQTQNLIAATLSGNTSGVQALISSGTMTIAGGNNITVSQAGNAFTISGPNVGGAQTGISGLANSQTTYTSGTVSLSELGAITIRSTTGNQFQLSVNSQTVQTQNLVDVTLSGNTSGALALISSGTLTLAGGNNITLSQAGNAVTISAGAGGGFSGGVSNVGNSSGDTGITGSRLVFAGGNSITLSQSTNASGGTITVSAPNASVLSAVAPLSTSTNGSTISILGPAQLSVGFSTPGNTSGDTGFVTGRLALVGSNGITLSGSTNAGSQTITISGVTQSAESQSIGMSNLGNTSGTTGIASGAQVRMLFAGGNNITLSQSLNGASGTITISGPNTAAQTNQSGSVFAVGNTYSSSVGTFDARTLSIRGDGIISVAATNSGWRISASQSVQAETQTFVGGIAASNTTYTSGTITLTGVGGGVTVSSNTGQRVDISVAAQTVESQSIGMSNIGNTSGTTGVASGGQVRFVIAGGNNITLSQSLNGASGTITISAPNLGAGAMSAGVSNLGNTAGATGITGTQLVLVGTNAISLSQTTGANGGTVSIDAPPTSSLSAVSGIKISTNGSTISIGYGASLADWENMPRGQASLMSHFSGWSKTPIYWNDQIYGDMTVKSLAFAISMVTASQPLSLSAHLGVYTFANSTSANLLGSVSEAYVVSSASSVSLSGVRNMIMTGIGTHTALSNLTGGEYMLGMMFSATATNAMNASLLGASGGAGPLGGIYPGTNQLTTGTSQGIQALAGRGSTTVNAMPAAVSQADLVNQGQGASMQLHPWIYIRS